MITRKALNNKGAVNIYTDASIYKILVGGNVQVTIGCPGFIVVHNDHIIDQGYTILKNTTSNKAELNAILLGVRAAKEYGNNGYVCRLFSDSQLSVFAIRDRIFTWIENANGTDGKLYTVDGTEVKNLTEIMSIIYTIIENDIPIDIYHQKGHVNEKDIRSIIHAREVFCTSNCNLDIDLEFIYSISYYNNYVDNMTRTNLHNHISRIETIGTDKPFEIVYKPFDIKKYKRLIYKK